MQILYAWRATHVHSQWQLVVFIIGLRHRRESAEGTETRQDSPCAVFKLLLDLFLSAAGSSNAAAPVTEVHRLTKGLQEASVSWPNTSRIWQANLKCQNKKQEAKFKTEHKPTFVPIWKKTPQSIPEVGCWWEWDWQHANIKPLAMAGTAWTRKTKSRYWVRGATYCITLLNIKPSIRPSYLKDRTLWAIFPLRLLWFNPELHSHSCSSSAGEEVASNHVYLRLNKETQTHIWFLCMLAGINSV